MGGAAVFGGIDVEVGAALPDFLVAVAAEADIGRLVPGQAAAGSIARSDSTIAVFRRVRIVCLLEVMSGPAPWGPAGLRGARGVAPAPAD
ncbi:hypothetical protein [Geobacter anodireducens]